MYFLALNKEEKYREKYNRIFRNGNMPDMREHEHHFYAQNFIGKFIRNSHDSEFS